MCRDTELFAKGGKKGKFLIILLLFSFPSLIRKSIFSVPSYLLGVKESSSSRNEIRICIMDDTIKICTTISTRRVIL